MIELLLPLDLFWEMENLIKKVNYLTAAGEDLVLINENLRKILQKASYFTVREADRKLIDDRLKGSSDNNH